MNLLWLLSLLLMLDVQQNVARSMEEFEELKSSMVDIQVHLFNMNLNRLDLILPLLSIYKIN